MNNNPNNLWRKATKFLECIRSELKAITNGECLSNCGDRDFYDTLNVNQIFTANNNNKIDGNPNDYDVLHAYLCKLVYENEEKIKIQCGKWGFDKNLIKVVNYPSREASKTQAVVINHDTSKTIIIAFRGTELRSFEQWMIDFTINFTDINKVLHNQNDKKFQVHQGFYEALGLHNFQSWDTATGGSSMFNLLLDVLKEFQGTDNKHKISITGHSLGGALASLFTFALLSKGDEKLISGVYTYGQPLVGDYTYAEKLNTVLNTRYRRWMNNNDIVTRIPLIALRDIIFDSDEDHNVNRIQDTTEKLGGQPLEEIDYDYYHNGFVFKINAKGKFDEKNSNSQQQGSVNKPEPVVSYEYGVIFHHRCPDYAGKIKDIVNTEKQKKKPGIAM